MTISEQDEREATVTTDLRETIARLREIMEDAPDATSMWQRVHFYNLECPDDEDITIGQMRALLDAAERAETARDAALEEAAAIVEKNRHASAEFIAAQVRALRRPA